MSEPEHKSYPRVFTPKHPTVSLPDSIAQVPDPAAQSATSTETPNPNTHSTRPIRLYLEVIGVTIAFVAIGLQIWQNGLTQQQISKAATRDLLERRSRVVEILWSDDGEFSSRARSDALIEFIQIEQDLEKPNIDISQANLKEVKITKLAISEIESLDDCNFDGSFLSNSVFSGITLNNCTFRNTDLSNAHWDDCTLNGSEFDQCIVDNTVIQGSINSSTFRRITLNTIGLQLPDLSETVLQVMREGGSNQTPDNMAYFWDPVHTLVTFDINTSNEPSDALISTSLEYTNIQILYMMLWTLDEQLREFYDTNDQIKFHITFDEISDDNLIDRHKLYRMQNWMLNHSVLGQYYSLSTRINRRISETLKYQPFDHRRIHEYSRSLRLEDPKYNSVASMGWGATSRNNNLCITVTLDSIVFIQK